jgi:hypothetical protein
MSEMRTIPKMRLGKKQIALLLRAQHHGKIYSFMDAGRLDALHRKGLMTENRVSMDYTFYCLTPAGMRALADAVAKKADVMEMDQNK